MINPPNRPRETGKSLSQQTGQPSKDEPTEKVQRASQAIPDAGQQRSGFVRDAQALAVRLKGALETVRRTKADQAQNVIVRWKGDDLIVKALPTEARFYQQIAFRILKLFLHDKKWKFRLINDIQAMGEKLPSGPEKAGIIKSALQVARPTLQTGSFYDSKGSIEADRRLRKLINQIDPPVAGAPGLSADQAIDRARDLAHGTANPDEVDLGHIVGSTIATSVGGKVGSGGYACWTSALELRAIRELPQDRPEVQAYTQSAERSLPLNVRLQEAQRKSIFKDADYFSQLAADFKQQIDNLPAGSREAVFMDCNYKGHVMRAVFTKYKDGFIVAKLYDTNGDLEMMRGNFLTGSLRTLFGTKQKVCMEIHIEADAFASEGQEWLEQVIGMDSVDTHRKMEHQHLSAEQCSSAFRDVFASIPGTQLTSAMDYVQTTGNCYAKRLDAAQRDQLGDEIYLELRLKQYELLKPELERLVGIQRFDDAPEALSGRAYRRLRNKLRRYPKKPPVGDSKFGKLALQMYRHDRGVLTSELAALRR